MQTLFFLLWRLSVVLVPNLLNVGCLKRITAANREANPLKNIPVKQRFIACPVRSSKGPDLA